MIWKFVSFLLTLGMDGIARRDKSKFGMNLGVLVWLRLIMI